MDLSVYQLVICVILVAIGVFQLVRAFLARRRCSAVANGRIASVESVLHTRTGKYGNRSQTTRYIPCYAFEANGRAMEIRGKKSRGKSAFTEGEAVDIYYNPDDPEDYYCARDGWYGSAGLLSILLGLVFLASSLLF